MAKKIATGSPGNDGEVDEPASAESESGEGEGEGSLIGALVAVGAVVGLIVVGGSGDSGGLDVVSGLDSAIDGLTG